MNEQQEHVWQALSIQADSLLEHAREQRWHQVTELDRIFHRQLKDAVAQQGDADKIVLAQYLRHIENVYRQALDLSQQGLDDVRQESDAFVKRRKADQAYRS